MFKRLTDVITKERYYQDVFSKTDYRQSVCALSWPWYPRPGCVIVLAERRSCPNSLGADYHIDIKAEILSQSDQELIESAANLMSKFCVPYLITPVDDKREILIEYENDKRREKKVPTIRIQHPTSWVGQGEDVLPFYVSMLKRRLVDAKTLHFSQLSQIPTDIKTVLGSDKMALDIQIRRYPSICALCWAIEFIDEQNKIDVNYDKLLAGAADRIGGY